MSKERELLERVLETDDGNSEFYIDGKLEWDIKELLAQPEQTEQEPVVLQYRTKANYGGYEWSRWIDCSKEFYERREKTPLRNGFCYEVRKAHGIGEKNDPS